MKPVLRPGILLCLLFMSGCVYRYSEGNTQESIFIQVFNREKCIYTRPLMVRGIAGSLTLYENYSVTGDTKFTAQREFSMLSV